MQAGDLDGVGHRGEQAVDGLEPHLGHHHHMAVLSDGLLLVQLHAAGRRLVPRLRLLVVLPVVGAEGNVGDVPGALPPGQHGGGVDVLGHDVPRGAVPYLGAQGGEVRLGVPARVVAHQGEVVEPVGEVAASRDVGSGRICDGEEDVGWGEADGDDGDDGHGHQRSHQTCEDVLLGIPPAPEAGTRNSGHI